MNTMEPIRDINTINDIAEYLRVRNDRDYTMFMFGIYTGLRISDILPFRVRDVRNKDSIYLREVKRNKERKIILQDELKDIITDYIKGKEDYEFLFKSRKGKNQPIQRETAYAILKDAAKAFGIDCIGTHSMRKTYGYHIYLASDKDPIVVKEALNQSDIFVALRYIGVRQDVVNTYHKKLSFQTQKRK